MNKAVFLDRDGTINEEVDYLHEPEKLRFIDGVISALSILKNKGYKLIVISNQSGVGRGYFPIEDVDKVNEHMNKLLSSKGVRIDGFYFCPHTDADGCNCRKPLPYMYLKAAKDFDIDLKASYMVGDKETDILAADELGCGYGLVLSGHELAKNVKEKYGTHLYKNLLEFAEDIRG